MRHSRGGHRDPRPLGNPTPGPNPGCPQGVPTQTWLWHPRPQGCPSPPQWSWDVTTHPQVPPPAPGTLRPLQVLCDPPRGPHTATGTRCQPGATVPAPAEPRPPGEGKRGQGLQEGAGDGRTDPPESPTAPRGIGERPGRAGSGSRGGGGDSRGQELRGSRRHRWSCQVSPGWVTGMGLVPEPKEGREKQRKHKCEPAKGPSLGRAAASTAGTWVLSWGWGTQIKAGGHSWTPEPQLSPLLRSRGVERRGREPRGWDKDSE